MSNAHGTALHGKPLALAGRELKVGDSVPNFVLTANDMSDFTLDKLKGKVVIISSVPSLDTPVCSIETKHFSQEIDKLGGGAAVLTVSMDLPFAQKRWCGTEGVENIITASDFKHRSFGEAFGALIQDWGLLARAVFVVDKHGKVSYVEYVKEVSSEPNYEPILAAVKTALAA